MNIPPSISAQLPHYEPNISGWRDHVPFAYDLVSTFRPRTLVELGTHYGVSFFAFCQAVLDSHLSTVTYAVDTWQGDVHAGRYDESVFHHVRHQNQRYAGFSHLLRSSFDAATTQFAPQSIDLLHIDGCHRYEDARHDWETWLPKVSDDGIILLHDIHVREKDFGVWRLWEELKPNYPHAEFRFGWGLGIIAKTPAALPRLSWLGDLFSSDPAVRETLHTFYARRREELISPYENTEQTTPLIIKAQVSNRLVDSAQPTMYSAPFQSGQETTLIFHLPANVPVWQPCLHPAPWSGFIKIHALRILQKEKLLLDLSGCRLAIELAALNETDKELCEGYHLTVPPSGILLPAVQPEPDLEMTLQIDLIFQPCPLALLAGIKQLSNKHQQLQTFEKLKCELSAAQKQAQHDAEHIRNLERHAGHLANVIRMREADLAELKATSSWRLTAPFRSARHHLCLLMDLITIGMSGLWDRDYYLKYNPDVRQHHRWPLWHFVTAGVHEQRYPSPYFNIAYYLTRRPDVAQARINPLAHYIRRGAQENADPSPLFSTEDYRSSHPELRTSKTNPLAHFLRRRRADAAVQRGAATS